MTDTEREIIEAIFDAMEQMLRLLRTVLRAAQAGTPLDVARVEATATALAAAGRRRRRRPTSATVHRCAGVGYLA